MYFVPAIVLVLVQSCVGRTLYYEHNGKYEPTSNAETKHWALIVAGSNGWYNYRHQADACHAYQVLHGHGIPDERIVVMMYDDLAQNEENPTPGIIINRPNGTDVYHGVPKDYTGKDVTPENFLKILQGHSMSGIGSGKVIKSGPNDHVFVNFVDHGAPGIIAFPHGELHAEDLNDAIKSMNQNQQYQKMVFYIEACESGSMFDGLLTDNINVFATTAANGQESSYACYYDDKRQTYLGDVYSVKWMEDSDVEDLKAETLQQQYVIVTKETNTSHVQEYGDRAMGSLPVGEFQGNVPNRREPYPYVPLNAVPQEDVPLAIARHMIDDAQTPAQRDKALSKYHEIIEQRIHVDDTFESIISHLTNEKLTAHEVTNNKLKLTNHQCYKRAVTAVSKTCFELGQVDYGLRHLYKLVNLCENGVHPRAIELVVADVCSAA